MPNFRSAAPQSFQKEVITKGYGFNTPQDGSVCKIRVISDNMHIITDLDDSNEKEFIVGDVDEPVDRIIEDCIRTMKEEEECVLKFEHPNLGSDNTILSDSLVDSKGSEVPTPVAESGDCVPTAEANIEQNGNTMDSNESTGVEPSEDAKEDKVSEDAKENKVSEDAKENKVEDAPSNLVVIQFLLVSYTREPEIWEMSVTEKWRRASYHKQRGLELYSRGAYQYAFRRFGLTLKYVISLEHDIPSGQEEGMDIKGLKLSCYLNVAACQMRHYNFESVVINASKALALQPNNAKALYRRGAAYLQIQEYEKAKEDLTTAQQLEPKNQAVAKQLQLLKGQVQKLNQYYASAMKKLFA